MSDERQAPADSVLEILRVAERWLAARGVDAPRRSTELMIGRVLGLDRLHLYLAHDRPLTSAEKDRLRELVARRGRHEPLSYVLGDHDFRGHLLEVDAAVLIPRPETEELVDLALARAPHGARCADLGTGSGAIAIALARERPDVEVWAVDVSPAALEVARRNVRAHGLADRVRLCAGSYWSGLAGAPPFDLVVGNPPYVDPAGPDPLAPDVARFEPATALLTPPGDPAAHYREIVAGLPGRLVQ
jgi:release factor glutamine methyltransferase